MIVTLNFAILTQRVQRSLSIIGKRSTDENGNLLFKDITLGSLEESILIDYFKDALIQLKTATSHFSASTTDNDITLSFPDNHPTGNDTTIRDAFAAYCVAYALYSWFTVVAPRLAAKYQEDADRHMAAVIALSFSKQPPE